MPAHTSLAAVEERPREVVALLPEREPGQDGSTLVEQRDQARQHGCHRDGRIGESTPRGGVGVTRRTEG